MRPTLAAVALAVALPLAAAHAGDAAASQRTARAVLRDATGREVGIASFSQRGDGAVGVVVTARGLAPGEHGLHVHAAGRCDGAGFVGAGGHFDPSGHHHGHHHPGGGHAGDLPNLVVDASGEGRLEATLAGVTLEEGRPASLLGGGGTAVVLHAARDDQQTEPSGQSGDRIACGVVSPAP